MNARLGKFYIAATGAMLAAAASAAVAETSRPTADAIARAEQPAPYPSFASVPPLPKDVRPPQAWKAAVEATKAAGARVAELAASQSWTLHDTEAWAERERAAAAPPPPVTTPSEGDTEAFARAMRARATPPPRSR